MDVMAVTDMKQIPSIVCKRNQPRKAIKSHTICLPDSDHDFILDGIKRKDTIEYERDMSIDAK